MDVLRMMMLFVFLCASSAIGQEEPREVRTPKAKGKGFELVMASLNESWTAIRYHPKTGASAIISKDIWIQIKEAKSFAPEPNADFVVKVTAFGSKNEFAAIRMDRRSGASWFLRDKRWVPIAEFRQ